MNRTTKDIKYWKEARELVFDGMEQLTNAVISTMWPNGRNVILDNEWGSPTVTNDGVTIAREITLENKFENIGASLVKEASSKTNDAVGDGTTTTCALTLAIAREWMKYMSKGVNPFALSRGMKKAVLHITEELKLFSQPINVTSDITNIATISAQDQEIGSLIGEVMGEIGKDWVITVETGTAYGYHKEIVKWMQFDKGYLHPVFSTDQVRMEAVIANPAIIVTEKKITTIQEILPMLNELMKKEIKNVVIICDDIDYPVLNQLVSNRVNGVANIIPVKAPEFGDRRKEALLDICAVAGATLITENMKFEEAPLTVIGTCEKIIISKYQTIMIGNSPDKVHERTKLLQKQLKAATTPYDKEHLEKRIAKMSGGLAVIKAGAATETEALNKKYKIEDAINATKAAIAEGVVPWGGTALLHIAQQLQNFELDDRDEQKGFDLVIKAIQYPVEKIADNAGYNGARVVRGVKSNPSDFRYGFNALTGRYEDLIKSGVIDPTKVVRVSLENATSAASMFLTTDCVIVDNPQEQDIGNE